MRRNPTRTCVCGAARERGLHRFEILDRRMEAFCVSVLIMAWGLVRMAFEATDQRGYGTRPSGDFMASRGRLW